MAGSLIENLMSATAAMRGCPCGAKADDGKNAPAMAVLLQLTTLGSRKRDRAKAITIHLCKRCVRGAGGSVPLRLRNALGDAVYVMGADLRAQSRGANGD